MKTKISCIIIIFLLLLTFVISASAKTVSDIKSDLIVYAKSFIGKVPYVWGGTSLSSGVDCSGYICRIYEHFGINLWNRRVDMINLVSDGVATNIGTDINNAQLGDIIYTSGHVSLYSGNGNVVNALNSKYGVIECPATKAWIGSIKAIIRIKDAYFKNTTAEDEPVQPNNKNDNQGSAPNLPTSTYTTPQINLSKSVLNLSYSNYREETITIKVSGTLPSSYHLQSSSDKGLDIKWGNWSGNSTTLTVRLKSATPLDSTIKIYLKDDNDKTYASTELQIHIEVNVSLTAPSEINLDYMKNPTQKITVYAEGALPNLTMELETNASVSAKMGTYNGYSLDIEVTGKESLKDTDGLLTLRLVDSYNNIVLKSTQIVVHNASPLYYLSYDTNGGYYPNPEYVSKENGNQYKGLGFLISIDNPKRTGYTFIGWSKNANATSAEYTRGDYYKENENVVLYAVWKPISIETSVDEINLDYDVNRVEKIAITVNGMKDVPHKLIFDCDDNIDWEWVGTNSEGSSYMYLAATEKTAINNTGTIYLYDDDDNLICTKDIYIYSKGHKDYFVNNSENEITVYVDGSKIDFDVVPQIINNRTMVPMRAIFQALGAIIEWNANTVYAFLDNKNIISISIGDNFLYKHGHKIILDSPAIISNNRTLIPLRAIAECFGYKVQWHDVTRIIEIISPENPNYYTKSEKGFLIELNKGWTSYKDGADIFWIGMNFCGNIDIKESSISCFELNDDFSPNHSIDFVEETTKNYDYVSSGDIGCIERTEIAGVNSAGVLLGKLTPGKHYRFCCNLIPATPNSTAIHINFILEYNISESRFLDQIEL